MPYNPIEKIQNIPSFVRTLWCSNNIRIDHWTTLIESIHFRYIISIWLILLMTFGEFQHKFNEIMVDFRLFRLTP